MKRKLALLLAAVMTLSMLPMNVFATTNNSVTSGTTVIPKKSILYEVNSGMSAGEVLNNDDIEYRVEGGDLILTTNDYIQKGDRFRVTLENAKWFFRNQHEVEPYRNETASATALSVSIANLSAGKTSISTKKFNAAVDAVGRTYNPSKGVWAATGSGDTTGVYYRYADFTRGPSKEIPYSLEISSISEKEAVVTVLGLGSVAGPLTTSPGYVYNGGTDQYYYESSSERMQIRIPLVSLSSEDNADLKVKVDDSNTARIQKSTGLQFGIAGSALTKTYVDDPQDARDALPLNMIVIKETRISSLGKGEFTITAPSGFYFARNKNVTKDDIVAVPGISGLTYDPIRLEDHEQVMRVKITGLNKSTDILGAIYIQNYTLYPDDDSSYWGDVKLTIKNVSKDKIVTNETFKAGTRADWTISLTTEGTIPELINGRYKSNTDSSKADDDIHQTARVVFKENSVAAWWAERETIFQLPEGVKFRKVEVVDTEELLKDSNVNYGEELEDASPYAHNLKQNGKFTLEESSSATINGNQFTLRNFKINPNEKAKIVMDIWVSIESGFKGDVTLTVTGNAIPKQGNTDEVPAIVIAKQISPVTVTTKITDIKIGYQLQPTADVVITEAKAGILLRDKTVNVSVTDFATLGTEISFSPDTKVSVDTDKSSMKIKNIRISKNSNASSSALSASNSGTLQFDIDRVSAKPAVITLSNVSIKIDRTVPESNDRPYKVVVWGTAIAENYDNTNGAPNDTFSTAGVEADYLRVISAANDKSSLLSQRVEVAIGETTYTVNGETKEMDAAAYISPASNSTLVPVRFIANAFGIDDNQVMWSNDDKTVTIIHGDRVVQFKGNSDKMTINGTSITNYSPDGLAVVAEITADRMYVPFRALGDAFGVKVDYDNATKTAIYNPDANVTSK